MRRSRHAVKARYKTVQSAHSIKSHGSCMGAVAGCRVSYGCGQGAAAKEGVVGNEITKFGQYGNFDCQGEQSTEPRPSIPLGWLITVGASEKATYVGDCLLRG
jgi:hypothetical protein